ncbi:MAG: Hsp33 family molecular chaperone HslO [Alphaproteobacteria bacterium]|nr:Hsp33 family molecular chaperone HslO [Alphaproteobacteria bacterium]
MSAETIADNILRPFQLEQSALRGRLIRLGDTVDVVLTRHAYPPAVSQLLGEMFVLAATLAGGLKFKGTFSLQTRSDGPISLMVADCTHDGGMRGYAKFDRDAVAAVDEPSVPNLLGNGHFAVTVDQDHQSTAYQGLVELEGDSLTDCIHQYFRQSEQVKTGMKIAVEHLTDGAGTAFWRAGAVMVQCLPEDESDARDPNRRSGEALEDWRRTMMLLGTVKDAELIDPDLSPERLLLRLFHQEGVRIFDPQPLSFRCRCNRERVETLLRQFTPEDIDSMRQEDGGLFVTCEFCNETYRFEQPAISRLLGQRTH